MVVSKAVIDQRVGTRRLLLSTPIVPTEKPSAYGKMAHLFGEDPLARPEL